MNELEKIIQEYTEKTARRVQNEVIVVGEAKNVTDDTCEVHRNGYPPKLGVTLRSIERLTDTHYTMVPKEGSMVIAAEIEKNTTECVLISCSEIEKIIVKAGEQTTHLLTDNQVNWIVGSKKAELKPESIVLNSDGLELKITDTEATIKSSDMELKVKDGEVLFNGGANGGLIKIQDLVDRLNAVEADINILKDAISNWTPVSQDGGASLQVKLGALPTGVGWTNSPLTETQISDIENDKVKH